VNFCHKSFADFRYVVELVNDFIQQTKIDANAVPETTRAFPMLKLVGESHAEDHEEIVDMEDLMPHEFPRNRTVMATASSSTRSLAEISIPNDDDDDDYAIDIYNSPSNRSVVAVAQVVHHNE
jgi:hypothetical protein